VVTSMARTVHTLARTHTQAHTHTHTHTHTAMHLSIYTYIYIAMHPPPLHVTAAAPDIVRLRLGAATIGEGGGAETYGNVDLAEFLLYDDALSPQEMDRIGFYLAVKFGISSPIVGLYSQKSYLTRT